MAGQFQKINGRNILIDRNDSWYETWATDGLGLTPPEKPLFWLLFTETGFAEEQGFGHFAYM